MITGSSGVSVRNPLGIGTVRYPVTVKYAGVYGLSTGNLSNVGATPGYRTSLLNVQPSGTTSTVPGTPAYSAQSVPVISSGSLSGTKSYSWLLWVAVAVGVYWMFFRKKR